MLDFLIVKVFAQDGAGSFSTPSFNPLGSINSIPELITKILEIVVNIGLPIIALMIVYVGLLFVMARGKPEDLTKAKQAFLWTIVGAAIVLGAFVIQTMIEGTIDQLSGS